MIIRDYRHLMDFHHISKQYLKIINYFDDITGENKAKHHPNWPYISAHPCREGAALGNTNAFLYRIDFQLDTIKHTYTPKIEKQNISF